MVSVEDYILDVRRYDPKASQERVQKIVNYLGISLQSFDASLVSCKDESERDHIRAGYAYRILGMHARDATLSIEHVCQLMKADPQKKRVTFYYLLAKYADKLERL